MYLGTVRVYFTSLFNHNNFFDVTTAFFFSLHLLRDRHETPQNRKSFIDNVYEQRKLSVDASF